MIPQQPLQFPNSQGPAYFIPSGQVRLGTSFAFPYLHMYCKIYSLMIMTRFCPRIYCNMYGISIEEHLPFCVCVFLPLSLSPLHPFLCSIVHHTCLKRNSTQWPVELLGFTLGQIQNTVHMVRPSNIWPCLVVRAKWSSPLKATKSLSQTLSYVDHLRGRSKFSLASTDCLFKLHL